MALAVDVGVASRGPRGGGSAAQRPAVAQRAAGRSRGAQSTVVRMPPALPRRSRRVLHSTSPSFTLITHNTIPILVRNRRLVPCVTCLWNAGLVKMSPVTYRAAMLRRKLGKKRSTMTSKTIDSVRSETC